MNLYVTRLYLNKNMFVLYIWTVNTNISKLHVLRENYNKPLFQEDLKSKKFFINVLETRVKRHRNYAKNQYLQAEKKIRMDRRLTKFLAD